MVHSESDLVFIKEYLRKLSEKHFFFFFFFLLFETGIHCVALAALKFIL